MIKNKTIILFLQRLFFFVVGYLFIAFIFGFLFDTNTFNSLYNTVFLFLLVVDIVFNIIYIIKDYSVFKLFIVMLNVLIKVINIVISLAVVFTTYYADNILSQIFFNIVLLGLISYPVFIILFMINTYKGEEVSVDKSTLIILTNGLIVYILGFFVNTKYLGAENFEYLASFNFSYLLSLIYIPFIFGLIIYVILLFKGYEE